MPDETRRGRWLTPAWALANLAALTLAVSWVLAEPANSAPAPDSSAIVRLHAASGEWNRFRITTGRSRFMVTSLRFDAEGVVVRQPPRRPTLIMTAHTDPGEARRVAWSRVDHIEGMRSHSLGGAVVGAVALGLAGLGARQAFEGNLHDASAAAIVLVPIGAVLGGVVGACVGGTSGWHRLYP